MASRWLISLLLLFAATTTAHVCLHDKVFKRAQMASGQTYQATYPTNENTQPIRLRIDTSYLGSADSMGMTCTYGGQVIQALPDSTSTQTQDYTCQSADVFSSSLEDYLDTLINAAQSLWESSLKVIPVQGDLMLQNSSSPQGLYGGVYLSPDYINGIPDTDIVIFVTARPILQSGGATTETLAVATVVQEDQVGRSVFGHLNINPAGIDTDAASYDMNFGVVVHEMTHALGFNYYKFQDINPGPGQPYNMVAQVTLNVGAGDTPDDQRYIINSPRVVAWAQRYYGCPTVQGVELENQGGSGTALSHWEKRTTMNEYMTGTASRNPVFSELTLALLEDTGWYRANYSQAGQLLWGQGMGCAFTSQSCDNWPSSYNGYFCTQNGKEGCSSDYQAKGACEISSATNVPSMYQYFPGDPGEIGSYDLPDYCPLVWGYENGWCFDPNSASTSIVDMGESFSAAARCFTSSLAKGLALAGPSSNGCYDSYCTGPNELRVYIGGYWYLCPAGSQIKIIGFGGTLSCPSRIEQICGTINGTLAGSISGTYPGADTGWPIFTSISPNIGGPGLSVTINGQNFLTGIKVQIGDPLLNVVVVSPTVITAVIPDSDTFKNPTNIIEQQESVIVIDTKGRSAVGYDAFTIKVKLDKKFLQNAADYLRDNWLITAAIVVAIVITCLVCGYCCYRQKGKAEEADDDYL